MTRFNVSKMIEAAGERAGLLYSHPHMLRTRVGICWPMRGRHSAVATVAWSCRYQAHCALQRTECATVQRVLERLTGGVAISDRSPRPKTARGSRGPVSRHRHGPPIKQNEIYLVRPTRLIAKPLLSRHWWDDNSIRV